MDKHWLDNPRNAKRLWRLFLAVLAATVLAELAIKLHPHFEVEALFGFHAWYGFIACAAMILFARWWSSAARTIQAMATTTDTPPIIPAKSSLMRPSFCVRRLLRRAGAGGSQAGPPRGYFPIPSSSRIQVAPSTSFRTQSRYRESTWIERVRTGSKRMSEATVS